MCVAMCMNRAAYVYMEKLLEKQNEIKRKSIAVSVMLYIDYYMVRVLFYTERNKKKKKIQSQH